MPSERDAHERVADEGNQQDIEYPEEACVSDDRALMNPFRIAVQNG